MPFKRAHAMVRTVHPIIGMTCTVRPITPSFFLFIILFLLLFILFLFFFLLHHPVCAEIRTVDSQSDLRILLCMINQEILIHYFVIFSL